MHKLYGISHSLYTGRARSYLIKAGIPFNELSTGHESFKRDVLPKGKKATVPTLVTPEGQVIRDGEQIVSHFEASNGQRFSPKTVKQNMISLLFDVIGAEGLLRPAMHYRWNFPEENLTFLHYHFLHSQPEHPEREAKTQRMMDRMRNAGMAFGVVDHSKALVEKLYLEFLSALDRHFATMPYLLGNKPSIGDFGLIAPMFAHLGRDPKPTSIMHEQAINVYRWVERMNRSHQDALEFFAIEDEEFLGGDDVPDTLIDVLKVIAQDFVPETKAAADVCNQWLSDNKPEPGTPMERFLGMCEFEIEGVKLTAAGQPYRFYQLAKAQAFYDALSDEDRVAVDEMLQACSLTDIISIRLDRSITFDDNLEIWT